MITIVIILCVTVILLGLGCIGLSLLIIAPLVRHQRELQDRLMAQDFETLHRAKQDVNRLRLEAYARASQEERRTMLQRGV